jgi:uncharacterized membrane protein
VYPFGPHQGPFMRAHGVLWGVAHGILLLLVFVAICAAVGAAGVWLYRTLRESHSSDTQPTSMQREDGDDPERILKARLARGDITIEEYESMLAIIRR